MARIVKIKVFLVEDRDLKRWDDYVNAHSEGCVFQTSAWRKVVSSTYHHQPFYFAAKRGTEISGVLPLFLIKSYLFGSILATSPYASFGAICADGADETRSLVGKAIQLARELRVNYLELKSTCITECVELQRHTDYITYKLALDHPDRLWTKQLKASARRAVRKAQTFHLTCEQGHHLLGAFYEIMAINMRRLGTPLHSKAFYRCILSSFGSSASILVAKYQAMPVSALLLLRHQQEVTVVSAASLPEYWHMRPNNFVYWEAIKDGYSCGASFDFGRSLVESGPAGFKEIWGAEAKPLYYEYFLGRQKTIPRIHQGNPRYRLATSVWKYVPIGLTKLIGPHLIKNVP